MNIKSEKQPAALYWLFMVELWERFGFYTIQTIAVLYLSKGLHFSDDKSLLTIAALNAMLYLTPVAGGIVADKIIGYQRAILIGGSLLSLGYLSMAIPESWYFFAGCAILIAANGYFKPNVSAIVGDLYQYDDPRRDGGFTIFYMGINIGALMPSLFINIVIDNYGWQSGFFIAMIGMLLSVIIFLFGRRFYYYCGQIPKNSILKQKWKKTVSILSISTIAIIILAFLLLKSPFWLNIAVVTISALSLIYVLFLTIRLERIARNRMVACLVLICFSISFWMLYNQTFGSLMLFADRNMIQSFLGIPISAENTQFFNPFFIIILSPILAKLWIRLSKHDLNPTIAYKFSFGIWFITLGFAILWLGIKYFSNNGLTPSGWLVASYFLQTTAELLISPVGLAMITVLAPKNYVSMMMGMWFLSNTAAFSLSGLLASLTSVPTGTSLISSSMIYAHGYGVFALISLFFAILSLICAPYINRLTK